MIALVGILGALVLVSTGLARRRLPPGRWVKMALLWVGIFLLAWAAASLVLHLR